MSQDSFKVKKSLVTKAISRPSNPENGEIYYDTAQNKHFFYGNGSWTEISAGLLNHVSNPNAEAGTSGWATYADAAQAAPVNGTGGTPNVTLTRTTSNPLRGTGSFLLTKDAADRQGQGVSTDLSIDRADRANILQISFDYEIASGTYLDGDIRVYLYDVTNSRLYEPSVRDLAANRPNFTYVGFVQPDAGSTSFRLILHVASTSTSAYTIKFDNVSVGPNDTLQSTGLTTLARSTQDSNQSIPDSTMTTIIFNNKTFDTTNSYSTSTGEFIAPESGYYNLGVSVLTDNVVWAVGNLIQMNLFVNGSAVSILGDKRFQAISTQNAQVDGSDIVELSAGDIVTFRALQTRGAATTLAADPQYNFFYIERIASNAGGFSSQSIAARYDQVGAVATTADTDFNFADKIFDTSGSFSSGLYTAPQSGYYQLNARMYINAATYIRAFINGSVAGQGTAGDANGPSVYNDVHFLSAGDTISIRPVNSGTTAGGASLTNFSIIKVTAPAGAQPNELVSAKYNCNAGPSVSSDSILIYETKLQDTHSAYNTSTGVFTAPIGGTYSFSASALSTAAFTGADNWDLYAQKNGSVTEAYDFIKGSGDSNTVRSVKISSTVQLNAGDTFTIRSLATSSIGLATAPYVNVFSIYKV